MKKKRWKVGDGTTGPEIPRGGIPEGTRWESKGRHPQKGYILGYWLRSVEPQVPTIDELPPQEQPQYMGTRTVTVSVRRDPTDSELAQWRRDNPQLARTHDSAEAMDKD